MEAQPLTPALVVVVVCCLFFVVVVVVGVVGIVAVGGCVLYC